MGLTSMTGFGRGEASRDGITVNVELSTVNRRQFDARLNLPRWLLSMESTIHELLHASVSRGQVNGVVRINSGETEKTRRVRVNRDAARTTMRQLRKLARELKLPDDLGARALLDIPDLVEVQDDSRDSSKVWPMVERALRAALRELTTMRKTEGNALDTDLRKRMARLERTRARIMKRSPQAMRDHEHALTQRIKKVGLEAIVSDPMLTKEIVQYVERATITEELVRLESHFAHVYELMNSRTPCGRALDFLCQEMFREINTVGSKSGDSQISRHVITFKSELESVREQVQNVE
jgi:uncharacterized protein (TIGR00255 family)